MFIITDSKMTVKGKRCTQLIDEGTPSLKDVDGIRSYLCRLKDESTLSIQQRSNVPNSKMKVLHQLKDDDGITRNCANSKTNAHH